MPRKHDMRLGAANRSITVRSLLGGAGGRNLIITRGKNNEKQTSRAQRARRWQKQTNATERWNVMPDARDALNLPAQKCKQHSNCTNLGAAKNT